MSKQEQLFKEWQSLKFLIDHISGIVQNEWDTFPYSREDLIKWGKEVDNLYDSVHNVNKETKRFLRNEYISHTEDTNIRREDHEWKTVRA